MASCAADAQTTALISGANVCIAHHAFSHAHESSLSIPPSPLSRLVRLTAFRKAGAFGLVTSVHVPLQRPPSRVRKTPRTNDDAPPADGEADMVSLLAQNRMRAVKRPRRHRQPVIAVKSLPVRPRRVTKKSSASASASASLLHFQT